MNGSGEEPRRPGRVGEKSGLRNRPASRGSQGQGTDRSSVCYRESGGAIGERGIVKTYGRSQACRETLADSPEGEKSGARFAGAGFSPSSSGAIEGAALRLQKSKGRPDLGALLQGINGHYAEVRDSPAGISGPRARDAPGGGRACYPGGARTARDLRRTPTCARVEIARRQAGRVEAFHG